MILQLRGHQAISIYIDPTGAVNRLDQDAVVTLKARITKGAASAEQSFTVTVKRKSYQFNKRPIYQYDFESSAILLKSSIMEARSGNANFSWYSFDVQDDQRGGILQIENADKAVKANYLSLPTDTFNGMTKEGFTVGDVGKCDTANASYWEHSALFEANAGGQNAYPVTRISANLFGRINSNGAWADATAISKSLTANTWQYVTYTVDSQGIAVYLEWCQSWNCT